MTRKTVKRISGPWSGYEQGRQGRRRVHIGCTQRRAGQAQGGQGGDQGDRAGRRRGHKLQDPVLRLQRAVRLVRASEGAHRALRATSGDRGAQEGARGLCDDQVSGAPSLGQEDSGSADKEASEGSDEEERRWRVAGPTGLGPCVPEGPSGLKALRGPPPAWRP